MRPVARYPQNERRAHCLGRLDRRFVSCPASGASGPAHPEARKETIAFTFAIVGLGPRGSYALEQLTAELCRLEAIHEARVLLFEESDHTGNGPVWSQDQSDANWLNITERALKLDRRPELNCGSMNVSGFPSYHEWADLAFDEWPQDRVDTFPPRSKVGRYLSERHASLYDSLLAAGIAERVKARVSRAVPLEDGRWRVETSIQASFDVDDLLLTIGHQPTSPDSQIESWRRWCSSHPSLTLQEDAYPVTDMTSKVDKKTDVDVAIRGYGLATIDVARAFAQRFGRFTVTDERTRAQVYEPTTTGRLRMVPFSLDGLTMGPKPLTPRLDSLFAPSGEELRELGRRLGRPDGQGEATSEQFLIESMSPIITRVYADLLRSDLAMQGHDETADQPADKTTDGPADAEGTADIKARVEAWLDDAEFEHESLMSADLPAPQALRLFIKMATGAGMPSLDYCAGQVWRQCQPTIYASLSHNGLKDDVFAEIIFLDERMKRYAYGPPVESLQQLKALHDAGVLVLDFVKDPDIELQPDGWKLSSAHRHFTASMMINAVLDNPKIRDVETSLMTELLENDLIQPVHDELGIVTDEDGYVVSQRDDGPRSLAVLGRLVKGTVIGVDAILECFGERPRRWARAAAQRVTSGH